MWNVEIINVELVEWLKSVSSPYLLATMSLQKRYNNLEEAIRNPKNELYIDGLLVRL